MGDHFTLITGRTRSQAEGLHKGAGSTVHLKATSHVEVCPDDMVRLGITEGAPVRLYSDAGMVEAPAREGDLPPGLLFMPMGPAANRLVGTETSGTGMPIFKGQRVKLEPL